MNSNLVLTCLTCEGDTDCRIGFSNRRIQPLQFSCPHCTTLIELTLDITNAPGYELSFKNGEPREDRQYRPFDGRNPFVDLHLDFPVTFGKYVMGLTPFMAAMGRIEAGQGDAMQAHAANQLPAPLTTSSLIFGNSRF